MPVLLSRVVAVASEPHLDLDEEVLPLAEAELADVDVDVRTCRRDDSTWSTRDLADAEPATLGDGDVQASVGSGDGEDAADAASESVPKVVCVRGGVSASPEEVHGLQMRSRKSLTKM